VSIIAWSDEATFKLNGTVNRVVVCWVPENPHIHVDKAVSFPVLILWCGLSYRGSIGQFLEERVTGLCTSTCFGHPFYLSFISCMGMSHFTCSKWRTTTLPPRRQEPPTYWVSGYEEEVVSSSPDARLT
jgi:hypothetical protein